MKQHKIRNLLDAAPDNMSSFNTKNLIEVHDQPGGLYKTRKTNKI